MASNDNGLSSNTVFRGVIVAMFAIIMAISGVGASLLIYNLQQLNALVQKIDVRLSIAETRIDTLERR